MLVYNKIDGQGREFPAPIAEILLRSGRFEKAKPEAKKEGETKKSKKK